MMLFWGHFLIEDIFDVVCPVGIVYGGPFDGLDEGVGAVFVFEGEEFFKVVLERLMSVRKTFEVGFGLFSETDKGLYLLGSPQPPLLLEGCFPVGGQLDTFSAFIGAWVCGDGLFPEIDGEGVVVRFDDDPFTDGPWGHGIGVCIEADGEVGVDLCRSRVPTIREELGQGPEGL